MKLLYYILVVYWVIQPFDTEAQSAKKSYKLSLIDIPVHYIPFFSFQISDDKKIFVPLNGGIYMPQDSIWFLPPSKNYYFTSLVPMPKDSAFLVIGNTNNLSELFYVRTSNIRPPVRSSLLKLQKGVYNLIYKNKICFIWGFYDGVSKIGIMANKEVRWLFSIKGFITQVQVNALNEIFFSVDNTIYQLTNGTRLLTYDKKIYGFDFDSEQRIVFTSDDGLAYVDNENKLNMIQKKTMGLVNIINNSIFILPPFGMAIYKID